jgi:hypothetical protein
MKLRAVLTIAAFVACLRPAVAAETSLPFGPADMQTSQTPAQVFVHENGDALRGAKADDDGNVPLYTASGSALLFTLDKWRAGGGTVDVEPDTDGSGERVTLTMHRLIAFGHYSVFVRTDGSDGPRFAPLDRSGLTNNFDAHQDGSANIEIDAANVNSGTWIVTIYHSDAQDHGNSPGDFTRTAHQQLIVKVP